MIKDNSMLQSNPEIIDSEIDDETVMMNIDTGAYFGLDSIASTIWQKLEEPLEYAALIDQLSQRSVERTYPNF